MMEYKTEESNELKRKEVESNKESINKNVERFMTFDSDIDIENEQETAAYNNMLIKEDLDIKLFIGKEIHVTKKIEKLQKDIQSVNGAAGFVPIMSSTSLGENIDPHGSEFEHEVQQKNLEEKIDTGRNVPMKRKWLNLRKANQCVNIAAGLLPEVSSASLDDSIDANASEYEHELDQKNLEIMNLRGGNVPMKHKLIQLRKAHEWLKAAAALLPAVSSASLGENINPHGSEFEHELHQQNLEDNIDKGRKVAMKQKLLNLKKATQSQNSADDLEPAMSISTFLGDNIDHSASQYKNQLDQENLEMKIMQGRNVAMKDKLLQLRKAHEWLKAAAALLPALSSESLGKNINPHASEYERELQLQSLEMKIDTERNVAMKHKWLKLQKANQCVNIAAELLPEVSSASLNDAIDPSASAYEHELDWKNLEVMNLRGRYVPIKHKLLQLRKAHEWLKAAAALLPAVSSASLGEHIDLRGSEFEHELHQQNLEVKIDTGRNVPKKYKLLNLKKATQLLNSADDLEPVMPISTFLGDDIDHSASQYKNQLEQQNLEMKIMQGRNVAMKDKLLQLRKAHEWLKAAAALLAAESSASLSKNINPHASEYEFELQQQNLEVKINTARNTAKKQKWLKLWKANHCINIVAGLLSEVSSASLDDGIHPSASEYEHELDQKNLEVVNLRGRNVPIKHKLIQLRKAHEWLKAAADLLPAVSSASLGKNINSLGSEFEHELHQKNLEAKIDTGGNVPMKHKWLKLQKANQCVKIAAGLLPEMSSASLDDGIDPSASEYEYELDQKNLEVMNLRGRNILMKHKLIQLRKAHEWLKVAAALLPAMSSPSLGNNINPLGSKFEHELHEKNLEVNDTGGKVPMKHKLIQLRKAHEWLKAAAALLPAVSSASLGEHIDLRGSEFEHELHQQNLEVKIDTGRNGAKKYKLLNLKKATQLLNSADDLEPAMPISTFLGDDIDHSASQCKNQLEQQNLEMKILRGKNVAMNDKLLQVQNNIQYLNAAQGFLPANSSASLDKNIDLNSSGRKDEVEQKNVEMKILRERHTAMKRKLLKLCNASQSINVPAGLVPAMPALTSLGDNVDPNASEYEHQLELKDMDHRTSSIYQHLQNRMTCWI